MLDLNVAKALIERTASELKVRVYLILTLWNVVFGELSYQGSKHLLTPAIAWDKL